MLTVQANREVRKEPGVIGPLFGGRCLVGAFLCRSARKYQGN